jgi:hypothetical protein
MDWIHHDSEAHKKIWADGRLKETITREDLLQHVPGFAELLEEVRAARDVRPPEDYIFGSLLRRMAGDRPSLRERYEDLVGWFSHHPDPWVHTCRAFEVGLWMLLEEAGDLPRAANPTPDRFRPCSMEPDEAD